MANVNLQIILGRVGKDPETRQFANGGQITNISIATTFTWKTKDGEKKEETTWHDVKASGKLSEIIDKYVRKGDMLYVQGRTSKRSYDDKDGIKRYVTEVVADSVQLMPKGSGNGSGGGQTAEGQTAGTTAASGGEEDDNLPF